MAGVMSVRAGKNRQLQLHRKPEIRPVVVAHEVAFFPVDETDGLGLVEIDEVDLEIVDQRLRIGIITDNACTESAAILRIQCVKPLDDILRMCLVLCVVRWPAAQWKRWPSSVWVILLCFSYGILCAFP